MIDDANPHDDGRRRTPVKDAQTTTTTTTKQPVHRTNSTAAFLLHL